MQRRTLLALSGALAGSTLAAPAIAQSSKTLTMVTSWPKGLPGLQLSAERLAKRVTDSSGGALKIEVAAAGEMVEAFEVFEAVSAGVADIYHSVDYYRVKESPAYGFFGAVPFGLTADEMTAWIHYGGGQEVWDALGAESDIKPLLAGNTGIQMGGWFAREMTSIESYKGLRYRMPGLGGEVLTELGATVVGVPGGKINNALSTGAIDAAEWVGPWLDVKLGIHEAVPYYYYPGIHEPGTALAIGINKSVWEGLGGAEQSLIAGAAAAENNLSLAEFNANNARALGQIIADGKVELRRFDDETLAALLRVSNEILADRSTADAHTKDVYASFVAFRETQSAWTEVADRAYLNARGLG